MKLSKPGDSRKVSLPEEIAPLSHQGLDLRSRNWKRFISAPDSELLNELYIPGLSKAIQYDRSCAYFSSRVLATAARGFGGLIENLIHLGEVVQKPAVRLLVNEQLDANDVEQLLVTGDQSKLERLLLKHLTNPVEELEKNRLEMLAWLVAKGWLDVRVGIMARTGGIVHAKYGILTDPQGNRIAFMGSDNETGQALLENYEEVEIRPDWEDKEFVDYYQQRFETIWNSQDPNVAVFPLPDAVKRKLIALAPAKAPAEIHGDLQTQKAAILWHYLAVAPYLPNGEYACDATAPVDPWPHQHRVVEDTARAFPSGRLLCDEVGMGKTIEAILILRRLLYGRGVKRALLLVPAGLLRQWQDELREKGALIVPRWENNQLFWPDGKTQKKVEAQEALAKCDILLLSREWARLESNRSLILNAPAWDLTLLDEAHAARRKYPKESEFNSANLLLELLRNLQLRKQTRGILLLSATPMQTQPWEPWDLLSTLGIGNEWLVDFNNIRNYYDGVDKLNQGGLNLVMSKELARIIVSDDKFPAPPTKPYPRDERALIEKLSYVRPNDRPLIANWLRKGSPLGRRMHRNTRETLLHYYEKGMLSVPPPKRELHDILFDYENTLERGAYEKIKTYIDERYSQLEKEKSGKGFVMTIYRRRAASSPLALRMSLGRRKARLERFVEKMSVEPWLTPQEEGIDPGDLSDLDDDKIDPGMPAKPEQAKSEIKRIDELLGTLDELGAQDSKLAKFYTALELARGDGRAVLIFTEYTDTMDYLRQQLQPTFGKTVGCYSGRGGEIWHGNKWELVSKTEITDRLFKGELKILVCTDAASEGLNLQAAGALINYDLPWNPSRVEQRIGRIDRIGQVNKVIPIYNLFLMNSVDVRVYQVLHERCGLFEHFVGRMQPVLSMARDAFAKMMSAEEVDRFLQELSQRAKEVEEDATISAAYEAADAEQFEIVAPPVTRQNLELGIEWLSKVKGKIRVKQRGSHRWEIKGIGQGFSITTQRSELEKDEKVQPLSVGSLPVISIKEALSLPARAPLVVVEKSKGAFHCAEVRWIDGDQIVKVKTATQLAELAQAWNGAPVSPDLITTAQKQAEEDIWPRLLDMEFQAEFRVSLGLERQLDSATRRLRSELGRTLRCFSSDINEAFRKQVKQESDPNGRYHLALRQLRGYPTWATDELKDFENFVRGLDENHLNGRIRLASELDAALKDPRWAAEFIRIPRRTKINLYLDMPFTQFSDRVQKEFITQLAETIKTDPSRIKVLRVIEGSVIVPVEMDEKDAAELLIQYRNGAASIQSFTVLRILGIYLTENIKISVDPGSDKEADLPVNRIDSLKKQWRAHTRSLLAIQEKRAEMYDPRNVSPDLIEAEKYQQDEIKRIELQLKEYGIDINEPYRI